MKKITTLKELKSRKEFELEIQPYNMASKYYLWTEEGYCFDDDGEHRFVEGFMTVKEMLKYVNYMFSKNLIKKL